MPNKRFTFGIFFSRCLHLVAYGRCDFDDLTLSCSPLALYTSITYLSYGYFTIINVRDGTSVRQQRTDVAQCESFADPDAALLRWC